MLGEEEYASSTDESDEDYNPNADDSNALSEVESDGEAEDNEVAAEHIITGRKRKADTVDTSSKSKKPAVDSNAGKAEKMADKELVDDDDDENEDAIWASFLSKSAEKAPQLAKLTAATSTKPGETAQKEKSEIPIVAKSATIVKEPEQKRIVTEIFEFAGEKVEVKKEVKIDPKTESASASSQKQNKIDPVSSSAESKTGNPLNRPRFGIGAPGRGGVAGGGLSSVLGQLGKKNKLSILEKTKLDWSGFKQNEGIDEELQTHNKGRDGFLERQDFLERTDLRRFEIEKSLRQTTRRK